MEFTYLHVHILLLSTYLGVLLIDVLVHWFKLFCYLWINYLLNLILLLRILRLVIVLLVVAKYLWLASWLWAIIIWSCTVVNYWYILLVSITYFLTWWTQSPLFKLLLNWQCQGDTLICVRSNLTWREATKNTNLLCVKLTLIKTPKYISHQWDSGTHVAKEVNFLIKCNFLWIYLRKECLPTNYMMNSFWIWFCRYNCWVLNFKVECHQVVWYIFHKLQRTCSFADTVSIAWFKRNWKFIVW